jgi:lipoprotein-anchoring transpeptidase ErfK/SrfK
VLRIRSILPLPMMLAAGVLSAQSPPVPPAAKPAFIPPGTPGSPINGEVFHAQVLLDAAGFSPGVIDGKKGLSLKRAIEGFQEARGLDVNGTLDGPTRNALLQDQRPSTRMLQLTADDVGGPFVYPFPKKPEDQAKLKVMAYRNALEQLSERFHTTPDTIVALNGREALIGEGQALRLPTVLPSSRDYPGLKPEFAKLMSQLNVDGRQVEGKSVVVDKSEKLLKVFDAEDHLVAQFPVTTGSGHDPLPIGTWKVTTYAFLPPFHYQPNLFWDIDDQKDEQKLPPGPNNPVGVAWLDLTKEHYGIHGTPEPQTIGRTESHGCIRMTNWDVLRLSWILKPGFTAVFQA